MTQIHSQWIVEKSPVTDNLNSIHLFDDGSGWIVGDNGTILLKVNDSWVSYPKITSENLYSVFMIDKNEGWAAGSNGLILHFTGGKWQKAAQMTRQKIYAITFRNANSGIAVGSHGTVLIYKNGVWLAAKKPSRGNLYTVHENNNEFLIGGGLECVNIPVAKVTDINDPRDIYYTNTYTPGSIEIMSIAHQDYANTWAVGRPGTIFHVTEDSWCKVDQFERLPALNSIFYYDENTGITVGNSGAIILYSGNRWIKQEQIVNTKLNGSSVNEKIFYAVGNKGTILSLERETANYSKPSQKNASVFKIESFPNPTSELLNIIIPDETEFIADVLTVTNSLGNVIFRKQLNDLTGGSIYWYDTSALSNGFYVINILSKCGASAVGKFIVKH